MPGTARTPQEMMHDEPAAERRTGYTEHFGVREIHHEHFTITERPDDHPGAEDDAARRLMEWADAWTTCVEHCKAYRYNEAILYISIERAQAERAADVYYRSPYNRIMTLYFGTNGTVNGILYSERPEEPAYVWAMADLTR